MSLIAGLLRAAFPVGSARRDRLLGLARRGGVLPQSPESSYQRWINSFETGSLSNLDDVVASRSVGFLLVIQPGATDPASVTRTLVSVINQSYPVWTAHLPDSGSVSAAARRVFADSVAAEARFTFSAPTASPKDLVVRIDMGDALAPDALLHFAATANRNPQASLITAEFDMIDSISGRRSAPAAVGSWEPDLADQFDLLAGCVARRGDLAVSHDQTTSRHISTPPHINAVLLHRLVGVRFRSTTLLPPAPPPRGDNPIAGVASVTSTTSGPALRRNGGTRVRRAVAPGTSVALLVRDPLSDQVAAQSHLVSLLESAGSQCEVVSTGSFATRGGAARSVTFPAVDLPAADFPLVDLPAAEVVVVIDGGLTPQENGWLDDVVGALLQPHVLAVAPLVVVPSGVVLDGGVKCTNEGLAARSGRADLAPFELDRCRQVASLSGRAMAIRRDDLVSLLHETDASWGESFTASLASQVTASGRCCLVWTHQRWTLDRGLDASPTDSPMLAWSRGRIAQWFDIGITPHQPEPGRAGEGVW